MNALFIFFDNKYNLFLKRSFWDSNYILELRVQSIKQSKWHTYLYLNLTLFIVFDFLSDNLLYWMIKSNCLQMHANKRILTNGSFKDGIEIQTNGSLQSILKRLRSRVIPIKQISCVIIHFDFINFVIWNVVMRYE